MKGRRLLNLAHISGTLNYLLVDGCFFVVLVGLFWGFFIVFWWCCLFCLFGFFVLICLFVFNCLFVCFGGGDLLFLLLL